jgi:hypothetical protein
MYKNATDEQRAEMKSLPFLGNFRSWDKTSADASGTTVEVQAPVQEMDDLPF